MNSICINMNCKTCNVAIPYKLVIEGKLRILSSRQYCLNCHPWRKYNEGRKQSTIGEICERCHRPVGNQRGRYCASCVAIRHKQSKKRKLLEYKGGKCEICGYDKCVSNLVFHHRAPSEKTFTITAALSSTNIASLQQEVDKCALLCCRCHGEVHEGLVTLPPLKFS